MLLSFSYCENQRFGWGWWGAKSCVSLDSRVLTCFSGDWLSSMLAMGLYMAMHFN